MLYNVFLFNLVQPSLIIDDPKLLILGKRTRHLEHYTRRNRTLTHFPKNCFSLVQGTVKIPYKGKLTLNSFQSTMHIERSLTSTAGGMKCTAGIQSVLW